MEDRMTAQAQATRTPLANTNPHKAVFWREWALLTVAGTLAALAVLPAIWSVVVASAHQQGISLPVFLTIQFLQSAAQVAVLVAIGLFFARRTGLGAPIIESYLAGDKEKKPIRPLLAPAIGLGILGAVATIALDGLVFARLLPGFSSIISQIAGWQGLLASFDGGILEELELRLFLLSVLAWLFSKVRHTDQGLPTHGVLWLATAIAASIFGLLHLPATSLTVAITPWVVVRAILLNGMMGMLFGYFYWKRGLEAAILCHFSADIVLHFVWPMIH
jgi:membrane protease YdiL (CAAX protease family)